MWGSLVGIQVGSHMNKTVVLGESGPSGELQRQFWQEQEEPEREEWSPDQSGRDSLGHSGMSTQMLFSKLHPWRVSTLIF